MLRAGLGMVDPAQAALPEAEVGFVGVARDEQTHRPVPYLAALPDKLAGRSVMVLDPMLATGGDDDTSVRLVVRPSGTEPKVKCYLEIRCAPSDDLASSRRRARALRELLVATVRNW